MAVLMNLVGWAGSALLVISLLLSDVRRFRVLNLISSVALIAFNALLPVPNWPMAAVNAAITIIDSVKLRQLSGGKRSPKTELP